MITTYSFVFSIELLLISSFNIIGHVKGDNGSEYYLDVIILLILAAVLLLIKILLSWYRRRRWKQQNAANPPASTDQVVYSLPNQTRSTPGRPFHRENENDIFVRDSPPIPPGDILPPAYSSIVIEKKADEIEIWEEPPPYDAETMHI